MNTKQITMMCFMLFAAFVSLQSVGQSQTEITNT